LPSRLPLGVLAAALLLAACSNGPDVNEFNYQPEINLFGLLIYNSGQTIIRLEETYRAMDRVPADRGIAGAQMIISGAGQAVTFTDRGEGRYATEGPDLCLQAGATYTLSVRLQDGRRIEAHCTMPAPPRLISPADHQVVAANAALPIAWEPGTPDSHFLVSVRGNVHTYSAEMWSDSTATNFYPFYLAQPDIYVLKVTAMDRNYYNYLLMRDDEEPVWHIQGGIGVFGAIAYDERIILAK